jgi:hypothetical protein
MRQALPDVLAQRGQKVCEGFVSRCLLRFLKRQDCQRQMNWMVTGMQNSFKKRLPHKGESRK